MNKKTKLTKHELLWIFAVKDQMVEEFYEEHYGKYSDQPTDETLYILTKGIVSKTNGWEEVMRVLEMEKYTWRMFNKMDIYKKEGKDVGRIGPFIEKEYEPSLEQWLWKAVRYFLQFRTREWLDWWAQKDWEKVVDEFRKWEKELLEETPKK